MKIGIIGTRGIPNQFGGFEQFAERFSVRMADRGHDITVYCSGNHKYTEENFKNVRLVHCSDPEKMIGTFGQFIYDFNCIRHSRTQNFDLILQLGYTSSTVWSWIYPKSSLLVTNMDGLEWSRAKYNKATQYFLTYAEKWGAYNSDYLIADSIGIQEYLYKKYHVIAALIPYGADVYHNSENSVNMIQKYAVSPFKYDLVIARFEPENSIESILKTYKSLPHCKLILIGNYSITDFGRRMYKEYGSYVNINFAGANYNIEELNALRYNSRIYIHGHSVGGTNPSLLEAMASNALICANNNRFNKDVLGGDSFYFNDSKELTTIISSGILKEEKNKWLYNNKEKIVNLYNWDEITSNLESDFKQWISERQNLKMLQTV